MSKKKKEKIGTINGMEILKKTRPIQDIPFRTGSFSDKRKKEKKQTKGIMTNGYNSLICFFVRITYEKKVDFFP